MTALSVKAIGYSDAITVPGVNLNLTVTSQDEMKNLVKAIRTNFQKRNDVFSTASTQLGDRKRTALYEDLASALAVAEVLLRDENADYLLDLLEEHNIPVVTDATKQNEYVPLARLMWGHWPKPTKKEPDPDFVWSRSTELYGKVLRGAVTRGITAFDLFETLKKENGFKKFKEADDNKYSKSDQDVAEKERRRDIILSDQPMGILPSGSLTAPKDSKENLVSLLARVNADGSVEIIRRLDVKHGSLVAILDKVPLVEVRGIENRILQRELAEERDKRSDDGITIQPRAA
ncbi:hypothetical protein VH570_17535 [Sphingobium sp. HT1-2]|uniref:hypothetical protein n=1 Tax=Sphingobium sp. HT1-2 TaxID=3111640 RepID=UPI003C06934B